MQGKLIGGRFKLVYYGVCVSFCVFPFAALEPFGQFI